MGSQWTKVKELDPAKWRKRHLNPPLRLVPWEISWREDAPKRRGNITCSLPSCVDAKRLEVRHLAPRSAYFWDSFGSGQTPSTDLSTHLQRKVRDPFLPSFYPLHDSLTSPQPQRTLLTRSLLSSHRDPSLTNRSTRRTKPFLNEMDPLKRAFFSTSK